MGETRHIPTWSQRFQMAFCNVFEVVTGRAARATMSSAARSSRVLVAVDDLSGLFQRASCAGARWEPGPLRVYLGGLEVDVALQEGTDQYVTSRRRASASLTGVA